MARITKCPNCGGKLEYISQKNTYKCLHCGSSFDEEEPKEVQKEPQAEDQSKVEQPEQEVNFEKESYSDMSYKEVQKARLRGKMYKLDVPKLDHMLHKTEKKRTAYVVFASIMFVLAAIAFGLAAFLFATMVPPLFAATGEYSAPSWDVLNLGKSIVGFGVVLGAIFAFALIAIFAAIGGYLIYDGRKSLQLSTATKEEMAYGPTITRFIFSSVLIILGTLVVALVLLFIIKNNSPAVIGAILGIAAAIIIGFVAMLVKLVRDKVNAVNWFKTLPEAEQNNYREHADAIKSVRRKKERMDERNRRIFWR